MWIVDTLAQRLKATGEPTLHALRAHMAERRNWWRNIPGIGPITARALAQFVRIQFELAPPWAVTASPSPTMEGRCGTSVPPCLIGCFNSDPAWTHL
ncbi:hypothetical protein CS8_024370 [Cupriavidus sp. 8B]